MNDMPLEYQRHRVNVAEYHRMSQAGVFQSESRIELIDGELVETQPGMTPAHAYAVSILHHNLTLSIGRRAIIRCRSPITLGEFSEPEPDIAIVCGYHASFWARHPNEHETLAVIEVADRSRNFDIHRRIPIYAKFGIAEAWVIDLTDSCFRIFREPSADGYRRESIARVGESIALLAFPELDLLVDDTLC